MEIKILCPIHGEVETIALPEGYSQAFKGVIVCNPSRGGQSATRIRIELAGGRVISVELV